MTQVNAATPAWVSYSMNYLDQLDSKIDAGFPVNILQTKVDELAGQIKEKFSVLKGFDTWLQENNATEWYTQLATYLVKLPPKAAANVLNGLYNLISQALYLAVHPVSGLNSLAKSAVLMAHELTKSENWAKMGSGSIGMLTAQAFVLGGPISLIGLAIGGALIAGGVCAETVPALYAAKEGTKLDALLSEMRKYAKELPESILTGVFTGLLIGGIRRAFSSSPLKPVNKPVNASFKKIPNVAQYKWADWSNLVKIEHGLTLEQAKAIASSNPDINFFFYSKAPMILESQDWTSFKFFEPGDAAFFSGEPWWGSAPGMADGYIKM
jgi:hypothetical protein